MRWPSFNQSKLLNLLPYALGGSECLYVQWGPRVGLKLYMSASDRTYALQGQRRASEAGLAPRVGPTLGVELVQVDSARLNVYNRVSPEPTVEIKPLWGYWTEHAPGQRPLPEARYDELQVKLVQIGLVTHDLHESNVGRLRESLVAIDFGPLSMCKIPLSKVRTRQ